MSTHFLCGAGCLSTTVDIGAFGCAAPKRPIHKPLRHQGGCRHELRVAGNVRANMAQLAIADKG
jgi:hypothetical protein